VDSGDEKLARPGRGEGGAMPGTYSQILLHVVFATKHRQPWITTELSPRLYAYMGGIIRSEKGVLYEIGGVEDHVHMLMRWRTDMAVSDLMRHVKGRSSLWVHETMPELSSFAWQEGYSVFSVSKSRESAVKRYIAKQAEHHQKHDFRSELLRLLKAHGIEFDERYVFD
jgi:REP element-mobilizing transposase RayT